MPTCYISADFPVEGKLMKCSSPVLDGEPVAAHFVRVPSELPLRVSHISQKSGLLLSCDFALREPLAMNAMDNVVSTCLFVFIYSS